jgi:hypothetical protein
MFVVPEDHHDRMQEDGAVRFLWMIETNGWDAVHPPVRSKADAVELVA